MKIGLSIIACHFCHKSFLSKGGAGKHETACKENPNRVPQFNQHSKAKSIGEIYIVSEETKKKLSLSRTGRKHTIEGIANITKSMKMAVINNPDSYRGTYNRGNVKEIICSNGFSVLGSWEKLFVEYCILNSIKIEQPRNSFSYEYDGVTRTYFPDFYLPDIETYIEIKGLRTDRDLAKWNSVINLHHKRLIIIEKLEIKEIKNGTFKL